MFFMPSIGHLNTDNILVKFFFPHIAESRNPEESQEKD